MARRKIEHVKAANTAAREALIAATEGGPGLAKTTDPDLIGDLTWWDPKFGWRGDVAEVAACFAAEGFIPEQILPPSPDWIVAFGRAVTHVRAGLGKKDFSLIDAAKGPNGERRVAVVKISRNGKVTTQDEGTVCCPKDGSKPYVETPDSAGIAADIVETAATTYFNRYISDDLRSTVVQTFERAAALPGRAAIPYIVYYAPPMGGDLLRRLKRACAACGWGRIKISVQHASDVDSKEVAVEAANDGLETRLNEFADEVAAYADADPTTTRAATIESKIEDARRLRAQGALYRMILGAAVESVDERINAIEATLKRTLGIVEKAHVDKAHAAA